jgi:hypothetical protein
MFYRRGMCEAAWMVDVGPGRQAVMVTNPLERLSFLGRKLRVHPFVRIDVHQIYAVNGGDSSRQIAEI